MLETVTTIMTGVFIAAVSAWITVQLSLNKFRSERWWERRVEAYERVIEALHHIKATNKHDMNARLEMRQLSEEAHADLGERVRPALREMDRAADVGAFFLSPEAQNVVSDFRDATEVARQEEDPFQSVDGYLAAADRCLKEFIEIARKDLGHKERPPRLWRVN